MRKRNELDDFTFTGKMMVRVWYSRELLAGLGGE